MTHKNLPIRSKWPNGVSSDVVEGVHAVAPYELTGSPDEAWTALRKVVRALPRTRIVTDTDDYLHAQSRSLVFRFVDDVEFQLRLEDGIIGVRSEARVSGWDWGVNRRRVEQIRTALRSLRVVR